MRTKKRLRIGIIGGGPSALFTFKNLLESEPQNLDIHIFEKEDRLGAGMPYSKLGASLEHVTNVSDNEIPELQGSVEDWVQNHQGEALNYQISPENFNEYKVLPRLLFGAYLSSQFEILLKEAEHQQIPSAVHTNTKVEDITYDPERGELTVITLEQKYKFDRVVICIGHAWPKIMEDKIPGYFDSPYPPQKLKLKLNNAVAIKGSSLTAIDAIRTLSRCNGQYIENENGMLSYQVDEESQGFKLIMHSRNGFLPAVRFHLDDPHLDNEHLLSPEDIAQHRSKNQGFLSLDFIFENNFKNLFKEKDIAFYEEIKDMSMEEFVDHMMELREELNPFVLLKAEYTEAGKSIKRRESIYWKEAFGVLSFAMNQPAKHFSAEDIRRLKKVLLPLISIVIAYIPQSSCKELLALYEAGVLDLIAVGDDSETIPEEKGGITYQYTDENHSRKSVYYPYYINCVGQAALGFEKFPFKGLLDGRSLSEATYQFQSEKEGLKALKAKPEEVEIMNGIYHLKVSGFAINDDFQVVDKYGAFNPHLYMMAVPYISGYNPDYSGLDFCEAASKKIVESLFRDVE